MKLGTVKVRILDEVNVVFVGLRDEHVNRLYEKYGVFAPNYFFTPTFKLGQWDGKIRYFQKTGKTYLFLLDEILPVVVSYGYKIAIEDLRKTVIIQPDPITADIFADIPHIDTGEPIILREYQVNLANALIQEGYGIGLSSTGSGKTLTMAAVVKAYNQKGIRTITIVPNQSLVRQTKLEYINCKLDTGEYSGAEKTLNHQNVVSTWQALQNNLKIVSSFDMVIVDECLDENTLILMASGETKKIKEVGPGDNIISYNVDSQVFEPDEVIKLHTNLPASDHEKMYKLEFDNGTTLEVTGNHKILTERGYVRADEINGEDDVNGTGCKLKLIRRTEIKKPEHTYNLHVKKNHNYIANGLVVSNCHQTKGNVLQKIVTNHAGAMPYRFGFTGTLPKEEADLLSIHVALGPVRYEVGASSLIEQKVLSNLSINVFQLEEDLTQEYQQYCKEECVGKPPTMTQFKDSYFPDFSSEKSYLQHNWERINWIARLIELRRDETKGNVLCLVDNIAFGRKLAGEIEGAIFVNGQDIKSPAQRQEVYDMFKDRDDLVVIATVHIAGTGINIRRIFNLFLVDMGKSFIRVIQSIGRGLRKAEDKEHVNVWDICSDLKYSKRHMTTRTNFYKEAGYPFKKHKVKYFSKTEKF